MRTIPFYILILLISFPAVNAVLFTPGLTDIAKFFAISNGTAQLTISWYLIGYACGQLLYGPLANRYGRKPALYIGIALQIMSSLFCVFSKTCSSFEILMIGRVFQALGAGVGLKMTFTLVNECYEPKVASQKIAYLMLAFAIMPGLSVALGGELTEYFGWVSCFYATALYGLILMMLVTQLPETKTEVDYAALQIKHLVESYGVQFKNSLLLAGGLLMGSGSAVVYVFAAFAPFVAMSLFGMTSTEYGFANLLPPIGLVLGSICSAQLAARYSLISLIKWGIIIPIVGALLMIAALYANLPVIWSIFVPMIVIYFGGCFIFANASSLVLSQIEDKAHASAVLNFLNMGCATVAVLSLGLFPLVSYLLPAMYVGLCIVMLICYLIIMKKENLSLH